MFRFVLAVILFVGGGIRLVGSFQDYQEGSCGQTPDGSSCSFVQRLDDPVMVVISLLAMVTGVLLFLNKFPLWREKPRRALIGDQPYRRPPRPEDER